MKTWKIEEVKEFMEFLFLQEIFDKFCVGSIELRTLVPITIQGNLLTDWLSDVERETYGGMEYAPWKLLRPTVFSLIKGKQTPARLRIQFVHYMENGDCGGFRIQYENSELMCISTYTPANFSLDKSGEQLWDENCAKFLAKNKIVSTQI